MIKRAMVLCSKISIDFKHPDGNPKIKRIKLEKQNGNAIIWRWFKGGSWYLGTVSISRSSRSYRRSCDVLRSFCCSNGAVRFFDINLSFCVKIAEKRRKDRTMHFINRFRDRLMIVQDIKRSWLFWKHEKTAAWLGESAVLQQYFKLKPSDQVPGVNSKYFITLLATWSKWNKKLKSIRPESPSPGR